MAYAHGFARMFAIGAATGLGVVCVLGIGFTDFGYVNAQQSQNRLSATGTAMESTRSAATYTSVSQTNVVVQSTSASVSQTNVAATIAAFP